MRALNNMIRTGQVEDLLKFNSMRFNLGIDLHVPNFLKFIKMENKIKY